MILQTAIRNATMSVRVIFSHSVSTTDKRQVHDFPFDCNLLFQPNCQSFGMSKIYCRKAAFAWAYDGLFRSFESSYDNQSHPFIVFYSWSYLTSFYLIKMILMQLQKSKRKILQNCLQTCCYSFWKWRNMFTRFIRCDLNYYWISFAVFAFSMNTTSLRPIMINNNNNQCKKNFIDWTGKNEMSVQKQ